MSAAPASRAKRRPARKRPAASRPTTPRHRKTGTRGKAANRRRRRRILRRTLLSAGALAVAVGLLVLIPLGLARDPALICIDDPQTFPEAGIEGWSGEQLENAATIIRTAPSASRGRGRSSR